MNHEDARNLTFYDAIPADCDEAKICVAFAVNEKTQSLRFLTGRFSPSNLNGQIVWFPLAGGGIHTVSEIYKRQDMKLDRMDWSPGQPYFNNIHELGHYDFETETRTSDEIMTVLKATASRTDA